MHATRKPNTADCFHQAFSTERIRLSWSVKWLRAESSFVSIRASLSLSLGAIHLPYTFSAIYTNHSSFSSWYKVIKPSSQRYLMQAKRSSSEGGKHPFPPSGDSIRLRLVEYRQSARNGDCSDVAFDNCSGWKWYCGQRRRIGNPRSGDTCNSGSCQNSKRYVHIGRASPRSSRVRGRENNSSVLAESLTSNLIRFVCCPLDIVHG